MFGHGVFRYQSVNLIILFLVQNNKSQDPRNSNGENMFNSTDETIFIKNLSQLHKLAQGLVETFNNRSIERFSSTQLECIQNNMTTLHHKMAELKIRGTKEDVETMHLTSNGTKQLYLDTILALIKYNEIVTKLL